MNLLRRKDWLFSQEGAAAAARFMRYLKYEFREQCGKPVSRLIRSFYPTPLESKRCQLT